MFLQQAAHSRQSSKADNTKNHYKLFQDQQNCQCLFSKRKQVKHFQIVGHFLMFYHFENFRIQLLNTHTLQKKRTTIHISSGYPCLDCYSLHRINRTIVTIKV